ncbi:MAG: glycosyltransferase family 2 protein [Agitococcus sp.]
MELTILMPCLNEAETIVTCINKAKNFLESFHIEGEVLIADNGSTDGSQQLAIDAGARVANIVQKGYGSALLGGINAAKGKFVIMGDADDSYDFSRLEVFVEKLRQGDDLVMGNRFLGGIADGAMPPLHRYLGNPVLSFIGRLFYRVSARDFHCGLRGFNRDSILRLKLNTPGMEFASEMVVKAALANYKISEVPTTLQPDGRSRPPHLRSWRDGWRHLRFLLLFSPRWLFLYPGVLLFILSTIMLIALTHGQVSMGDLVFDIHTMLYAGAGAVIGSQMCLFALITQVYGVSFGVFPKTSPWLNRFLTWFSLEKGLVIAGFMMCTGISLALLSVFSWQQTGFKSLEPTQIMRLAIPASSAMIMAMEVLMASFFLSLLNFIIHKNKK